ncbi:unnamed protein product [Calypogeia fissa]
MSVHGDRTDASLNHNSSSWTTFFTEHVSIANSIHSFAGFTTSPLPCVCQGARRTAMELLFGQDQAALEHGSTSTHLDMGRRLSMGSQETAAATKFDLVTR